MVICFWVLKERIDSMFLDKETILSEDQALTTTANSTNVVDLSGVDTKDVAPGEPLDLLVQVTADLTGGTSVAVTVETDDDEAFGSATTVATSAAIAAATLVAGYRFAVALPAQGLERYLRLTYTIVGTFSAGTVSAAVILDRQTNS
jgi:hypothetical protein